MQRNNKVWLNKGLLLTLWLGVIALVNSAVAAELHNISIKKFKFSPSELTISVGDTIRWTNKEKRQYHSVWFEALGEPEPDYFFPDEFYERNFKEAGYFPYRCGPHPKMLGTIHVLKQEKSEKKLESSLAYTPSEPRQKEILSLLKHDCGSCHGMTLQGGLGPSLLPKPLSRLSLELISTTITLGRPGTPMPPWQPFLNQQETDWLAKQLLEGIPSQEPVGEKP